VGHAPRGPGPESVLFRVGLYAVGRCRRTRAFVVIHTPTGALVGVFRRSGRARALAAHMHREAGLVGERCAFGTYPSPDEIAL
jgi:hypothetical protein